MRKQTNEWIGNRSAAAALAMISTAEAGRNIIEPRLSFLLAQLEIHIVFE